MADWPHLYQTGQSTTSSVVTDYGPYVLVAASVTAIAKFSLGMTLLASLTLGVGGALAISFLVSRGQA